MQSQIFGLGSKMCSGDCLSVPEASCRTRVSSGDPGDRVYPCFSTRHSYVRRLRAGGVNDAGLAEIAGHRVEMTGGASRGRLAILCLTFRSHRIQMLRLSWSSKLNFPLFPGHTTNRGRACLRGKGKEASCAKRLGREWRRLIGRSPATRLPSVRDRLAPGRGPGDLIA